MITKEMVNKYLDNDYHKWIANILVDICNDPSEINILRKQIKEDWDFSGMVEDARILFRVGYAIGQHSEWPQWSEGTEFKAKREAMLKSD